MKHIKLSFYLILFTVLTSCVNNDPELDYNVKAIEVDSKNQIYLAATGHAIVPKFLHSSQTDWWIKKYDSDLNEKKWGWNKKIDYKSSQDVPNSITVTPTDEIFISGHGNHDWWSLNWNTRGRINRKWKMSWAGDSYDEINMMVQDNHNDMYAGGDALHYVDENSGFDGIVNKFDHHGTLVADFEPLILDSGGDDSVTALMLDSGMLYVGGDSSSIVDDNTVYEGWIRKYSIEGLEVSDIWDVTINFTDYDKIREILLLPDRTLLVVGWSFILHYTEDGDLIAGNWGERYKENNILHVSYLKGELFVVFHEFSNGERITVVDRMDLAGNSIDGDEHFFIAGDTDWSLATVDNEGNFIFASGSEVSKYNSEGQLLVRNAIF